MSSIRVGDLLRFHCLAGQKAGPILFSMVQHKFVLARRMS